MCRPSAGLTEDMLRRSRPWRAEDDFLDWIYVRYRSVYLLLSVAAALGAALGGYFLIKHGLPRVSAPEAPSPPVIAARFAWTDGSVKVRKAGRVEWVAADKTVSLERFDLVRTGPHAVAEIVFFDRTVIHVRPDSLITIEEGSEDQLTKGRQVAWHVSSGEVNFETARRNVESSVTSVSTPTARGTIGELTRASVSVADTGASHFRLFDGSGTVETRGGQTVELASEEALRVDEAGTAGPKQALPAPPVILEPPHQAALAYPDPPRSRILLSWTSVPGAASYRVMMDESAYFSWPFLDHRGLRENSVEIRGLDRGRYYWRVAAQASPELEGGFSDYARLTIARPSDLGRISPPPLAVETVDLRANILQIKGTTAPGASVTVNGRRLEVRPDGSFNEYLILDAPGRQTLAVRATGLDGGVTARTFPLTVSEP